MADPNAQQSQDVDVKRIFNAISRKQRWTHEKGAKQNHTRMKEKTHKNTKNKNQITQCQQGWQGMAYEEPDKNHDNPGLV